LVLTYTYPV